MELLLCSTCRRPITSAGEPAGVCLACAFELALIHPAEEDAEGASLVLGFQPFDVLGPYRLLDKVGEGGMGEVWRAEQTEPVRRLVAVKVIKPGMDTREVLARFDAERQALAVMDHPCVSKVLDAGATPEGRPFFVMEYVSGVSITEHCDEHALSLRQRIELFLRVCEGVQHAHQKALVHRDLKPSNVLVAMQDGVATPKIIDFGVAKAMAQPLTERTLFTTLGALIGTPEYMSPEQADPLASDVDTRTDVYSLGVLLYELLAGALPFESVVLREAGFDGVRRMIREVEPPRPSTRLATLESDRSAESARRRSLDVRTLRRRLTGELDWITMKALEKDRARRYGSPAELAADLRRHVRNEPVLAGPPSAVYRAQKFVRRYRIAVTVAAIAILTLGGFTVAILIQASRVRREAEVKERVSQFLTELFTVSEPGRARGSNLTARELLDRGVARIRGADDLDPIVRAELMMTMGTVYIELGLYTEAEALLRGTLDLRRKALGVDDPSTLRTQSELGRVLGMAIRDKDSEEMLVEAVSLQKRRLGIEHLDTLRSMSSLARAYWGQNRNPEAEALFRETLAIQRRVLGAEHVETIRTMHGLGITVQAQERFQEAEGIFVETLALRKRVVGADHPQTLNTMIHLVMSYRNQGRAREAEELQREALGVARRVLGPSHPDTSALLYNLGEMVAADGRRAEALGYLRELVENGSFEIKYFLEAAGPGLRSLHRDPEFEKIVAILRAHPRNATSPP